MLKALVKLVLGFLVITGLSQFFLYPGMAWNLLFPLTLVFGLIITIVANRRQVSKFTKICLGLLWLMIIVDKGYGFICNEGTSPPVGNHEINVMTYNVFFNNTSPIKSIEVITKANPDVLLVQELTPQLAQKLSQELTKIYPFKDLHPLIGTHGIGIFSKYKISEARIINNTSNRAIAQICDLKIGARSVQIINTHLASPGLAVENKDRFFLLYSQVYKTRCEEYEKINTLITENSPLYDVQIFAGDMNTLRYEPLFKKMKRNWVNTFDEVGSGFGFNFPNSSKSGPLITIDYIMVKGKVECMASKVVKGGSSDHLGVMTKLRI